MYITMHLIKFDIKKWKKIIKDSDVSMSHILSDSAELTDKCNKLVTLYGLTSIQNSPSQRSSMVL